MRKHFKQVLSLRKESKTTTLIKSKPRSHVFSCFAMFYSKVFAIKKRFQRLRNFIIVVFFDLLWAFFLS